MMSLLGLKIVASGLTVKYDIMSVSFSYVDMGLRSYFRNSFKPSTIGLGGIVTIVCGTVVFLCYSCTPVRLVLHTERSTSIPGGGGGGGGG